MNNQSNQTSNESNKMAKSFWCFTCDTVREAKTSDICPRCGSPLVEVLLKPQLNVERLAFIGVLILLAAASALLLPWSRLSAPNPQLSLIETVLFAVFLISLLTIGSYWMVFGVGSYFGMPSGKVLFTRHIPTNYPEARGKKFSFRRLGIEAIKSLGILAAGFIIFAIISLARSCTEP